VAFRRRGRPTSANRASSFHLWWTATGEHDEVSVTLEVLEPPSVDRLYFWAVQASFVDRGRRFGAGHLGLMWNPRHPGGMAVNWGGYDPGGQVLRGTESPLPSGSGNANTRDFSWAVGRPYRLRIGLGSEPGRWAGSVTDLVTGEETVVRELLAGGVALDSPLCWSEVFADCDHPPAAVRWSAPVTGHEAVTGARLSFQDERRGGCSNTDVFADALGLVQRTGVERRARSGQTLPFPS
jgi:hypothetical protein